MGPSQRGVIRHSPCQRRRHHGCCLGRFEQPQIARLHTRQAPPSAVDWPRRAERRRFACAGTGERIAKPAAGGLPLAALVQHHEMQPVAMSSRTLWAATSTLALSKWQAAEPLPRSLNIVKRSPCSTARKYCKPYREAHDLRRGHRRPVSRTPSGQQKPSGTPGQPHWAFPVNLTMPDHITHPEVGN